MPGVPSEFSFNAGMEDTISLFKAKKVYKIVSVEQPPFMLWNETTRKYQYIFWNIYDKKLQDENIIYKYFIILEKYEGYCFDLIEEIKDILK